MIVSEKTAEVRDLLDGHRAAGRRVAMVGTSGGTHEGHLTLVRRAKRDCDVVAVFWNGALKLEWAPGTVQSYTRDLERDSALLEAAGVDLLYVPLRHDLYKRAPVSKGAINALTRQLAVDYGTENIRSNAIIVGFINTGGEVMQKLLADERYMQVIRGMIVLPRRGEPADVAAAAVYLASDESRYVTGTLLTVDGGATSHQPVLPRAIMS
jgi:hypothetical protein